MGPFLFSDIHLQQQPARVSQEYQAAGPEAATAAAIGRGQVWRGRSRPGHDRVPQREQFVVGRRVQAGRRDRGQPQAAGRVLRADREGTIVVVVVVIAAGPAQLPGTGGRRGRWRAGDGGRARVVHAPVDRWQAVRVREEEVQQSGQGGPEDQEVPADPQPGVGGRERRAAATVTQAQAGDHPSAGHQQVRRGNHTQRRDGRRRGAARQGNGDGRGASTAATAD